MVCDFSLRELKVSSLRYQAPRVRSLKRFPFFEVWMNAALMSRAFWHAVDQLTRANPFSEALFRQTSLVCSRVEGLNCG
jgi:hypothetical protein